VTAAHSSGFESNAKHGVSVASPSPTRQLSTFLV
jgi:hypothetical protein